jgi:4'-phosphopantetheinyl transferase
VSAEPSLVVLARAEPSLLHAGLALLTEAERRRALAFSREADAASYVSAHVLARQCVAALTGGCAAAVVLTQRCGRCGRSDHGKPAIQHQPRVHVSLSHSRDYVAAAAGWAPVGVDVEAGSERVVVDGLVRRVLTKGEREVVEASADRAAAFLRLWVRKEALIKVGVLTIGELADIDLSALPTGGAARTSRRTSYGHWNLLDWEDHGVWLAAAGSRELSLISVPPPAS